MKKDFYINDQFLIKPAANLVINGAIGKISRVSPGSMELLCFLAERSGKTVSSDDLATLIWQNDADAGDNLLKQISLLRELLQDDKKTLIRSAAKNGYSLHAGITNADISDLTREAAENGTPAIRKTAAQKWILILSVLIVILLIVFACWNYTYSATSVSSVYPETTKQAIPEPNESNSVVRLGPDSVIYKFVMKENEQPRFFINDRELPMDQWKPHEELINSLKRQLNNQKTQP